MGQVAQQQLLLRGRLGVCRRRVVDDVVDLHIPLHVPAHRRAALSGYNIARAHCQTPRTAQHGFVAVECAKAAELRAQCLLEPSAVRCAEGGLHHPRRADFLDHGVERCAPFGAGCRPLLQVGGQLGVALVLPRLHLVGDEIAADAPRNPGQGHQGGIFSLVDGRYQGQQRAAGQKAVEGVGGQRTQRSRRRLHPLAYLFLPCLQIHMLCTPGIR